MKKENSQHASGDLTKGNPWRRLLIFAIPIFLGGLLQQLYNVIDAAIVGHVVGANALGAVGSTGAIIQLLIALFMGLSSGACVIVARYFGKKDKENLNKTVHTAMLLSVIIGVIASIIGVALAPVILRLMNTPAEMFDDAVIYLQIFFGGMVWLAIYNMGASIFQAVGNSRYPLYFLLLTTVLNIVGDILFTAVFHMGVAGAALGTIISEMVAAVLVIVFLMKTKHDYKFSFKKLKIDKGLMKSIVAIGLPGAIQQSIVGLSNVFVQSYVNVLGTNAVSGYSAMNKLEAFIPLPLYTMALAITTYVSQNLGAGDVKRAKKGTLVAMVIGIGGTAFLSALALIFNKAMLGAFTSDPDVLSKGWEFGRIIIPFYVVIGVTNILAGALRGAGNVKFATISCIAAYVLIRQIYLLIITQTHHSILTVALGYPITWLICAVAVVIYYLRKRIFYDISLVKIIHTDGINEDFVKLCKKLDVFQNKKVPGRRKAGLSNVYNLENLKDIFLLYDGKKAIGCAGLWQHDDKTCEAVHVYVDSSYRGKNLEQVLLGEVRKLAQSLGYTQIHLRTYSTTKTIVKAYEHIGFSHIQPDNFEYADKYSQALLLAPLRVYMKQDLT